MILSSSANYYFAFTVSRPDFYLLPAIWVWESTEYLLAIFTDKSLFTDSGFPKLSVTSPTTLLSQYAQTLMPDYFCHLLINSSNCYILHFSNKLLPKNADNCIRSFVPYLKFMVPDNNHS